MKHCYSKIASILFYVGGLIALPASALGQVSMAVVHLVDHSEQDIYNVLGSGKLFVADFKGSNDVTVTKLTGDLGSDFVDTFGGQFSSGNPDYMTNFVGAVTNGTGDGIAGDLECIQTTFALSLQFDFALGLTPADRFLLIDCDNEERYRIQAFVKNGNNFNEVSLANWVVQNFVGSTEDPNLGDFPVWAPDTGMLIAAGDALSEPLTIFTPDRVVDRVIVTQTASTGSADLQFVHPTPASAGSLGIALSGTNVVLTIPTSNVVPALETTTNLYHGVWTTLIPNATPGMVSFPIATDRQQFFRLRF